MNDDDSEWFLSGSKLSACLTSFHENYWRNGDTVRRVVLIRLRIQFRVVQSFMKKNPLPLVEITLRSVCRSCTLVHLLLSQPWLKMNDLKFWWNLMPWQLKARWSEKALSGDEFNFVKKISRIFPPSTATDFEQNEPAFRTADGLLAQRDCVHLFLPFSSHPRSSSERWKIRWQSCSLHPFDDVSHELPSYRFSLYERYPSALRHISRSSFSFFTL